MKAEVLVKNEVLITKKSKTNMKWIILVLGCLSLVFLHLNKVGDYYCFDNPGAIQVLLKQKMESDHKDNYEYIFQLMYSVYSLPNIILPLIGGILIFQFGNRVMYITFGLLVLIGQFIFAFGCNANSTTMMLIGKL